MRTTARFEVERQAQLKNVFTRKALTDAWRGLVKDQLRRQQILDLHDYYDFNVNIESRADSIIERVLGGQYRAEAPVIYKLEKKLGICRHMLLPSPADALVFQVLTDSLFAQLVAAQPSTKAFYARDRHSLALPHEVAEQQRYPWHILWPKFQEEVWEFSKSCKYLVCTDLANYYDSIGFEELRRVVSSHAPSSEVLFDFMFLLIQDLAWTPDYLPRTARGLPVIEIEAPRLLAHSFLFEVDAVLKSRVSDNFVRWMDDINFGVGSKDEAHRVLGEISDVLKSRGLALNVGKTEVMTVAQVKTHFLMKENARLTALQKKAKKLKTAAAKDRLAALVMKELRSHLSKCIARNKDKVTKRYFTLLGSLRSPRATAVAQGLFFSAAGLRGTVLRYLSSLSDGPDVRRAFLKLLKDAPSYDDVTRLGVLQAIVDHRVSNDRFGKEFVRKCKVLLRGDKTNFDWYGIFLFYSKYGRPSDLLNFSEKANSVARKDAFLSRQIVASLSRAAGINWRVVKKKWRSELSSGATDSASAAVNLLELAQAGFPAKNHRTYLYLFPTNMKREYPVAKFLTLCNLAAAESRSVGNRPRPEVDRVVGDPWMRDAIRSINPLWCV